MPSALPRSVCVCSDFRHIFHTHLAFSPHYSRAIIDRVNCLFQFITDSFTSSFSYLSCVLACIMDAIPLSFRPARSASGVRLSHSTRSPRLQLASRLQVQVSSFRLCLPLFFQQFKSIGVPTMIVNIVPMFTSITTGPTARRGMEWQREKWNYCSVRGDRRSEIGNEPFTMQRKTEKWFLEAAKFK